MMTDVACPIRCSAAVVLIAPGFWEPMTAGGAIAMQSMCQSDGR
jgi:hypothetical protein